jgi:hypothetical protein
VGFGLANSELFRLMHTALRIPAAGPPPQRAIELIQAAGTGVVLTLIDQPEGERDDTLADTAWKRSARPSSLTRAPPSRGPAAAAVTLHAALPDLAALTAAERALLGDWLDRIAESQRMGG